MKWLILRGLVREQRHWGPFKEIFEKKLKAIRSDAQVFTMDMPGFGTEIHRSSPVTIDGIVEDMRKRLQHLKGENNENWGILAVSLGGMVAAHWAHKYPNDFKKVVLINSSMRGLSPLHHRLKPQNYLKIFKNLITRDLLEREKSILSMTTNLPLEKIEEAARAQVDFAKNVNRMNAFKQIVAGGLFKAPEKIQSPVLVLVGEGDNLVAPECSRAIAKQYAAHFLAHPTGNHDLARDESHWVADQVVGWGLI